jgi:hypothetical protein
MTLLRFKTLLTAAGMGLACLLSLPAQAGKTLEAVKARGQLVCGIQAWPALGRPTATASGAAWTSTIAAPWLPRCWAMPAR